MVKNGRKVQEERHWAGYKLIDELVAHRQVKVHRRAISLTEVDSKNVFEPDPNHTISPKGPKNSPEGPKKSAKKAPNVAKLKTKRYGCTSKTKVGCLFR